MRVSLFEIFLIQVILYTIIWLTNDYIASYMSIVIPAICGAILIVAVISEYIEPSKISRKYFWFMGISPEAFGAVGAALNFSAAFIVSRLTAPPPEHIQLLVEDIRVPRGAAAAVDH